MKQETAKKSGFWAAFRTLQPVPLTDEATDGKLTHRLKQTANDILRQNRLWTFLPEDVTYTKYLKARAKKDFFYATVAAGGIAALHFVKGLSLSQFPETATITQPAIDYIQPLFNALALQASAETAPQITTDHLAMAAPFAVSTTTTIIGAVRRSWPLSLRPNIVGPLVVRGKLVAAFLSPSTYARPAEEKTAMPPPELKL